MTVVTSASGRRHWPAIIGGDRVDTASTLEVLNPADGSTLAAVSNCGMLEVERAVSAARTAFELHWSRTTAVERSRLLHELSRLITVSLAELAELETLDTGKPLAQATADVRVAARYFEFYGNTIEAFYGTTVPLTADVFAFTLREPLGVTAHIIPWNYPIQICCRTVAPALATGNCCVVKPAEEAPLTPLRVGELALEAGFPPGVLNIVPGSGEEAGAALASHAGIDHLSFTGSVEIGSLVAQAAAMNVVPVSLELGGKSPNIVFDDADLDEAIPVVANSILQNAGQTCSAGSRLLVQETVHAEVVQLLTRRFADVTIGPGLIDPMLGPLISNKQLQRVEALVREGSHSGQLVTGGDRPSAQDLAGGYFYLPTIVDDVEPQSPLAREEVFGPVVSVFPFADTAEAMTLANSSDYGLIAAIWTQDLNRAAGLARGLNVGQVYVNSYGAGGGVELPFGGVKKSGYGREKGFEALSACTRVKSIAMRTTISA